MVSKGWRSRLPSASSAAYITPLVTCRLGGRVNVQSQVLAAAGQSPNLPRHAAAQETRNRGLAWPSLPGAHPSHCRSVHTRSTCNRCLPHPTNLSSHCCSPPCCTGRYQEGQRGTPVPLAATASGSTTPPLSCRPCLPRSQRHRSCHRSAPISLALHQGGRGGKQGGEAGCLPSCKGEAVA